MNDENTLWNFVAGVVENAAGTAISAGLIFFSLYWLFRRHPEYWAEVLNRMLSRLSDFEYHVLEGRLIWKFRPEAEQQEHEVAALDPQDLPDQRYKPVSRIVRTYKKGSKTYTSHAIDFEPINGDIPHVESVTYTLPNWFRNREREKLAPDTELRVAVWGGLSISAIVKSGQHHESHQVQLKSVA
jgi:hypothetical protein